MLAIGTLPTQSQFKSNAIYCPEMASPDQPLLFISHKHVDHELAKVLADFIKKRTGAQVRIHVSSDPDYLGPPAGRVLNRELRQTLWQTEVLILIYTSADQSWSYCLWECGVATNAGSPDTNIIVLQCGLNQFADLSTACFASRISSPAG
jgi:hypothetical protein